jgi:hypothetical protein
MRIIIGKPKILLILLTIITFSSLLQSQSMMMKGSEIINIKETPKIQFSNFHSTTTKNFLSHSEWTHRPDMPSIITKFSSNQLFF